MSYHHDHNHTQNVRAQFRAGKSPGKYGSIVGTVDTGTEKPTTGRSGDHLQFYLEIGGGTRYEVDVNTRSKFGTEVQVYIAEQDVNPSGSNPDEPFGEPAYGLFPKAQLSYQKLGLKDADFTSEPYFRIDSQLTAALNASTFVAVYGLTFDDGGPKGKGIHLTHYNGGKGDNTDGALAIYSVDKTTGKPTRTWYFFKFAEDSISLEAPGS